MKPKRSRQAPGGRKEHRQQTRWTRRAFLAGVGAAAVGGGALWLHRRSRPAAVEPGQPGPAAGEYRAVWISYLELQGMDYTTADGFRAQAAAMMDNCAALGLNTVLVQVRPFGDALYPSALYPWSHICTGTQGADPGFDPLDLLLTEAHSRGLSLEGWINPYRLRASASSPAVLAETSLANTHPEWVVEVNGGLYLNPAIPEAAAYVVDGVAELVRNYPVDGVHFDDYFYPTTDPSIDAAQFAASGAADLAQWRRGKRHRAGQGRPRRRQGPGPHPSVRGQSPGQPRQRSQPTVQRCIWLAGGFGGRGGGGLPLPPALLGVWLYPVQRVHPLCL